TWSCCWTTATQNGGRANAGMTTSLDPPGSSPKPLCSRYNKTRHPCRCPQPFQNWSMKYNDWTRAHRMSKLHLDLHSVLRMQQIDTVYCGESEDEELER